MLWIFENHGELVIRTWLWKVPLCSIIYLFIFMKNKNCEDSDFIGIERVMVKKKKIFKYTITNC